MGWTTTMKPEGMSATEYLLHHSGSLSWNSDTKHKYTVLDTAVVKLRTFYAAIERIDGDTGERIVWAAVILMSFGPRKGDPHNFGWKTMDETCGPNESECPERILNLLTPTDSEYANDWRARCRANIEKRQNAPKAYVGATVTLYGKRYKIIESMGRKGWRASGLDVAGVFRISLPQIAKCTAIDGPAPAVPVRQAQVAVPQQVALF